MNFYLDTLLNLPGVSVESCIQRLGEVHLTLRLLNDEAKCSHCGSSSDELHQNRPISLRDLSVFGQATYLRVPRRQFYCRACQRYFTESLSFMDEGRRYTQRYEAYVCQQVRRSSINKVSRAEGLTFDRIQGIVRREQAQQKALGKRSASKAGRKAKQLREAQPPGDTRSWQQSSAVTAEAEKSLCLANESR